MSSLTANTYPTDIKQYGNKSVGIAPSTTYKPTTTVFTPPTWFTKVAATTAVPNIDNDDFYIIKSDDDPFANFAAVVFAAAEDHDFAYGVTTTTAAPAEAEAAPGNATPVIVSAYKSGTSCLSLISQLYGKPPVKKAPELNIANSRLFRRRAEALATKAPLAAGIPEDDTQALN